VVDDGAPTTIEADPVRLAEILTNLAGERGALHASGWRVSSYGDGRRACAEFVVDDTGRGIPADQLRTCSTASCDPPIAGGTGLGSRSRNAWSKRTGHDRSRPRARRWHPHALRHTG
jgi:hypothetical protein